MLKNQIYLLWIGLFSIQVWAQAAEVVLGIDGLTCSQCMRSVEIAIRKQPGVISVRVDLQATIAYVEVSEAVQLPLLKRAVEQAGFSVRSVGLFFSEPIQVVPCMKWGGGCWVWQLMEGASNEPLRRVYLIGEHILSKQAYRRWLKVHRSSPKVCAECLGNVWYVSKEPYDEPAAY